MFTLNYAVSTNETGSIIDTVDGQTTFNVTVLVSVAPPDAVMRYVAVHVPVEVVGKVIVLSDVVIPVPAT